MTNKEPNTFVSLFIKHPVAANLTMLLFILVGVLGLQRLNKQIFPSFELDYVSVTIVWRGATAEDVQTSIITPVERTLRTLSEVRKVQSQATTGVASVTLEMEPGADINSKINDIRQRVDGIRNLPSSAEEPVINRVEIFKSISQMLIYGDLTLDELRRLAYDYEDELLRNGISKVSINGLPDEELAIEFKPDVLVNLGLSIPAIAQVIREQSRNLPAGSVGRQAITYQIRSISQRKTVGALNDINIKDSQGQLHKLGNIADIQQTINEDQPLMKVAGYPAVEIVLQRTDEDDALDAAAILQDFYQAKVKTLPPNITLKLYNESWRYLKDRIQLLLKNGLSGLVLVVITLFLFLNFRIAFWVTLGIPVSIMATLFAVYLFGGSINMISLFALIMALGIIVDDAIVVGEDTLAQKEAGANAFDATNRAAHRMMPPVIASSMTTIAAFTPLALVGGVMGKFMIEIPITVICVIIASLIESFLILPGHIYHSFKKLDNKPTNNTNTNNNNTNAYQKFMAGFNQKFNHFRDYRFKRWVEVAINFRWVTVLVGLGMMMLSINLLSNGYIKQTFFPTIDSNQIFANAEFAAGTPKSSVNQFLDHLETTLQATEADFGGDLIYITVQQQGANIGADNGRGRVSTEIGGLALEMPVDQRQFTNAEFIKAWQDKIVKPPELNKLLISQPSAGPPGRSLEILLKSDNLKQLKQASLALQDHLNTFDGVSNVDDNLPYGRPQMILSLTPLAIDLGLTETGIIEQIRGAYDGALIDIFTHKSSEIEIRARLSKAARDTKSSLDYLPIFLPSGETIPLLELVDIEERRGIDVIRQQDGLLSTTIAADIDESTANANNILSQLNQAYFPQLTQKYNVITGLEGKSADQAETMQDLKTGVLLGLTLIYIILAWVFGSYLWPLAVMIAIPLGLTGAILGHYLLGIDLSLFSLMGLFGLSGIVINDSIVLIVFFRDQIREGVDHHTAVVSAICLRLRAVLLTSLTTIAGLTPILFETSLQAQYLIPMAVTLVFGLAYGTFLILFFIPAALTLLEHGKGFLGRSWQRMVRL